MAPKRLPYNKARALALALASLLGVSPVWSVVDPCWPQAFPVLGSNKAIGYSQTTNSGEWGKGKLPDNSIMPEIF